MGDGVITHNNSSFLDNQLLAQEARDWSVRLREAELKFQVLEKNLELTKKMRAESERRMERAEEERNEAERQLFVQRNANKVSNEFIIASIIIIIIIIINHYCHHILSCCKSYHHHC